MSAHCNCGAIDQGRDGQGNEGSDLQPAKGNLITARYCETKINFAQCSSGQVVKKDRKADSERGRGCRARDQKLRPTVEESPNLTISISSNNVLGAGVWPHRRKFSVGERAGKGQQAGGNPDDDNSARRSPVTRHHPRLKKDAGADDVADVHGNGCDWTKPAD